MTVNTLTSETASGQRGRSGRAADVLRCVVIVLLLCALDNVGAAELSWAPGFRQLVRGTDNLLSAARDQEAALGFDTSMTVDLVAQATTWRSAVTPRVNVRRFAIGENADAEEYSVRSLHEWTINDRLNVGVSADYARDSTLTTELTDSGRNNTVVNRDTLSVQPNLNYALDERTALGLVFFYTDVSFEQRAGTSFSSYDYKQVVATLTHALYDHVTIFANTVVSEFRTPGNDGKALTYGGRGGANYRFSDSFSADFAVGYSQSSINFETQEFDRFSLAVDPLTGGLVVVPVFVAVDNSVSVGGPVAHAGLLKRFEYCDLEFQYDRAVSPSSFGAQTLTDDISGSIKYRVSNRIRLGLDGSYSMRNIESELVNTGRRNLNRRQVMLMFTASYRIDQEWAVSASYRVFRNAFAEASQVVYNNTLFLTLSFNGAPNFIRGF